MPETDIGKFFGQNLLKTAVDRLSLTQVGFSPNGQEKAVHLIVLIPPPVGPTRGTRIRVEDIVIIVWIGDPNPGQDIELETPIQTIITISSTLNRIIHLQGGRFSRG